MSTEILDPADITEAQLPDWNEADKRLKKLADYRIWCRERPIGYCQAYKITVPFNATGSATIRTRGMGVDDQTARIKFPDMDSVGDEFYHHLSEKKDDLIHSDTWDADVLGEDGEVDDGMIEEEKAERKSAIKYAIRLYEPWDDENDNSYEDVAEVVEDYSAPWVGNRVREWKKGEHRDLVPDPTEDED